MTAVALGVAGGTGSGKTTVARAILAAAGPSRIKRWADLIVPEGGENKVALEMVTARVEQLLATERPLAR
jgi:uridine kinase